MRQGARNASMLPAIVIGAGFNGLGVARSLASEGVDVILADLRTDSPTMRTRCATAMAIQSLAESTGNQPDAVDETNRLTSEAGGEAVLFLTQEECVRFVSEQRARLSSGVRFSLPDHQTMSVLLDKTAFQSAAETLGFPVPRSRSLGGLQDLDAVADLTFPCILKPTTKDPEWGRHFKKAYRIANLDELARLYRDIAPVAPDVIVQEWVEGTDHDVFFTLQYRAPQSGTVVSFTGRKLRQWPPQVGGTASCMPAAGMAGQLDELTTRFFDAVGFVGLGSMEYKRDPRNGRVVMIEPTVGRSDYQEEVAALNGVNVPYVAYASEAGLPVREFRYRERPRIWRDPYGDAKSAAAQPTLALPGEASGASVVDALFRWGDPMPWLATQHGRLTAKVRKLLGGP